MPDYQAILDNGGKAVGGRSAPARREVLRLLGEQLPGLTQLVNTRDNLSLPVIAHYRFACQILEGVTFPVVMVAADVTIEGFASRVVKRVSTISVHIIAGKVSSIEGDDDLMDLAELVEIILKQFKPGHRFPDPDGRRVWNTLDARSIEDLPEKWSEYAGRTVKFSMDQAGCDLWTPPQV